MTSQRLRSDIWASDGVTAKQRCDADDSCGVSVELTFTGKVLQRLIERPGQTSDCTHTHIHHINRTHRQVFTVISSGYRITMWKYVLKTIWLYLQILYILYLTLIVLFNRQHKSVTCTSVIYSQFPLIKARGLNCMYSWYYCTKYFKYTVIDTLHVCNKTKRSRSW